MRVFLDQIRDDKPFVLDEHLEASALDALLDGYESHRAESGLDVHLTLRLINGARVIVDGKLAGRVSAPCVLCLEPVTYPLDVDVMVTFMPESERARFMAASDARDRDDDGVELESDELDVMFYDEAAIDLESVVRESLLLELQSFPRHAEDDPDRPEDCVEAAARLGDQDSTATETDDGERPIDPRWAGLLELKNKTRDEN